MISAGRNAVAAVAVLVGLGALVAVPAAVDAALPETAPVPPGRLEIGYGVSIDPPVGARLDAGSSRPGTGEIVLLVDDHTVRVTAVEVRARPAAFVAHARRKFARDEGMQPGPARRAHTPAGISGQWADLAAGDEPSSGEPGCSGIFTAESTGVVVVVSPVDGCEDIPWRISAAVTHMTFEPDES
jgi:hypothetical protein